MPEYRRATLKGGTFFFTVVTYGRDPVFKEQSSVDLLWRCFKTATATHPFSVDTFVILPDHLHTIWTLPTGDSDFSTRWKVIKGTFSHLYTEAAALGLSESMRAKNEKGVWHRRFWEHAIRDQRDFERHCDYIHYNPVRHGLAKSPVEWQHSSFVNLVEKGVYPADWGREVPVHLAGMDFE